MSETRSVIEEKSEKKLDVKKITNNCAGEVKKSKIVNNLVKLRIQNFLR